MAKLTKGQIDYRAKFKDPRWQKKRIEILVRDDYSCQKCGNREKTLHVHHLYYEFNVDPWDYEDEALIVLCEDCHKVESELMKIASSNVLKSLKKKFYAKDLIVIAETLDNADLIHNPDVMVQIFKHSMNDNLLQRDLENKYNQRCSKEFKNKR